ncbi:helix-turn-helix domain-containing protein [Variovorax ginsengisoli]|uniref:AraC family transcriptional regulator n=1 Tax=Variovorax ginsengisoli TaxID=363844 RepID=A0ABT8SE79_9BURK|nr:AraC family transcriptional regulator [Variovorax ginsengisoli]MDN8618065.1 AraC family transcriptional regulator [Variovorax ginsengisoli]MDO1537235.1 AraC family transcriptional regulator [Variovorax ginsengisoli]
MTPAMPEEVEVTQCALLPLANEETERRRDAIEILIPTEGAAVDIAYRTDDGEERKTFLRAPLVALIPDGRICRVQCRPPGGTLLLRIAPDFLAQQTRAALGVAVPRLATRYSTLDPFVREVGNALQEELRSGLQPNAAYLEPLVRVLAVHLVRHYGGVASSGVLGTGLPQHKLRRVQAFIDEHITEPLHVAQLATEVHMSSFHFARMFKQATGQPPHLYVVMQRVERAKSLLSASDLALIDVAAQVGFRTQGHFCGVFLRYTGFTPRTFRLDTCTALSSSVARNFAT